MKGKLLTKALAATLCAAMAVPVFPAVSAADTAADDIVYSSDFEDGDISAWSKRGDSDTTVLSASDTYAVSGSYSLCAAERSQSWNGPSIRLDDKVDPGVAVLISAKVRGQWYTEATLSMQYDDAGGTTHYENLQKVTGADWQEINDIKVSYADGQKNVYIYFEGGSENLYVDDFVIKKAPVFHPESDIASLKDVYADSFKIGTAVTTKELAPNSTKELILKHFNSITVGNELKPDALLNQAACKAMAADGDDTDPQISLASASSILEFARKYDIPVRGHVLVWHSQTPTWFFKENYEADGEWVSKEKMLKRMENYIKNVFTAVKEEYPDIDFYAWDVVNEAWLDNGSPRQGGSQEESNNNSPWVKVFGDNSFIKPAFQFARKYAPEGTKLYYNDFNEYSPGKTKAMLEMAKEINSEEKLMDGFGLQSHLDVRSGADAYPSASAYKKALDQFCASGLDVQITELDATVNGEDFEAQAKYYSDIMDAIYANKDAISSVVFWGTTDDQSWRTEKSPLLFNADYTAKPCFFSIIDGIDIPEIVTTTTASATTTASETVTTTVSTEDPTSHCILPTEYGDVDGSGAVSVSDIVIVLQFAANAEKYPIEADRLVYADVNADNDVNAKDAYIIQQLDAGIISASDLPVTE